MLLMIYVTIYAEFILSHSTPLFPFSILATEVESRRRIVISIALSVVLTVDRASSMS